jgi:eukaryotic-like serine/threonine-protein kinase
MAPSFDDGSTLDDVGDASTVQQRGSSPIERRVVGLETAASIATPFPSVVTGEQARPQGIPERYTLGPLLGRGGMGEVVSARDRDLERNVAVKRMRIRHDRNSISDDEVRRFLREAKIQARLDHPAIVPIHEIAYDQAGLPFFTMKKITGNSMHDALAERRASVDGQLLRKFVDVCFAVDFAHQHLVVHRDLKPANIMLGDYGEVYVIDWGIARRLDVHDTEPTPRLSLANLDIDELTATGALMGTPGYMSPEQIEGELPEPASDNYALGCILFELLTGETLHPRGAAALVHTLDGQDRDPLARTPLREIAPELAALCVAATQRDPSQRPSARQIAQRIQQFLDGDRDAMARRNLAQEYVVAAKRDASIGSSEARARSMQNAARAISLDPSSTAATEVITGLLKAPTDGMPSVVAQQVKRLENESALVQMRNTGIATFGYLVMVPAFLWHGVTDWRWVGAFLAIVGFQLITTPMFLRAKRTTFALMPVISNSLMALVLSRMIGPWLITPVFVVGVVSGLAMYPPMLNRPWLAIGGMLIGLTPPVLLEQAGILQQTWMISNGELIFRSPTLSLSNGPTLAMLMGTSVAMVIVTGVYARRKALQWRQATEALEYQSWHLRQMLPSHTSDASSSNIARGS